MLADTAASQAAVSSAAHKILKAEKGDKAVKASAKRCGASTGVTNELGARASRVVSETFAADVQAALAPAIVFARALVIADANVFLFGGGLADATSSCEILGHRETALAACW